ncbi:MarR family winged helix-turn-helix transcriptional regulator [Dietzia sp. PP-33]|jgi:DNA-binding MarR family transcriptional regulator|uniref:MarR family winged helix-turn-helix transcriptional regulator n=1 Tax=Dietzia sp. PP-33 TaxID=2957500 RepID=UPI0029A8A4E0|nr:MarR family transcriptional regulator [Dietzia sp. PP-33]MDX2357541.1 MarR family transcriptional regulator [Dietzia sp. PP-33]
MSEPVRTEHVRWLTDEEKALWRDYLAIQGRLHLAIQRDLKASTSLTEPEFEVLVYLSEADRPLRMTALADVLQWERSRLSHQVTRMVKRGLVERTSCPTDGRGAFVSVTAEGMREIEKAAPDHVATVRRVFLDRLSEQDKRELARLLALVEGSAGGSPGDGSNRSREPAGVSSGA